MTQWEYVKGSEADFEGYTNSVIQIRKRQDNGFTFGSDGSRSNTDWLSDIIAERRKVDSLQSRVNDANLQQAFDTVQRPAHYNQSGIECIDAIAAAVKGKSGIEAVLVGNVIKYLWRYELKGGLESVQKAQWYLDRLVKELSK